MSGFLSVIKILAVFGILSLLIGLMFGGTSPFDDLENTLSVGVSFPAFIDPFTEETVRITAFAQGPTDNNTNQDEYSVVGCNDTNYERTECLLTRDGDTSYFRAEVDDSAAFNPSFEFNYSNPQFTDVAAADLRGVTVTFTCRTLVSNSTAFPFDLIFASGGEPNFTAIQGFLGSCPQGNTYSTVVLHRDYPDGVPDSSLPFQINSDDEGQALLITSSGGEFGNFTVTGEPVAHFTYFRIDIDVVTGADCVPAEGAWFPIVDQIACAIINFASLVWKGIQYVINGISFIAVTVGVVLVFLGQVVFGLLLGIIAMATWFLTVDAPDIVKSIFGIFTITAIAFPILTVARLIRGSE